MHKLDPKRVPILAFMALASLSSPAASQDTSCDPVSRPRAAGALIFDESRESDLGDAVHEHLQSLFLPIEDAALVSYLETVGERVRPYIPGADSRIRYVLSDAPWVQALSQVGGRIYVTRRMAAFVRSEDELAALLAHEIAHHGNRDSAMAMSRRLKALGVTAIRDRRDAFDKYNLLLDSSKPGSGGESEGEEEQIAADRLAAHATARAGYRPQALAEFWDRFAETRGQTGSWFSDLVGGTRPEMKRLREVLKAQTPLPPACIEPRQADDTAFARWQAGIKAHESWKRTEMLPGLVFRRQLEDPLQPMINRLAFSPDGRLLLAHDDAGIHVLSRDPFRPLFRIQAPEAARAFFSPDSRAVWFHTASLRVEKWDVTARERVFSTEIVRPKPCLAATLSPEGATLACLDSDRALIAIDVATGSELFRKDGFAPESGLGSAVDAWLGAGADLIFSPDGRYLLAAHSRQVLAYDLNEKKRLSLGGQLDDLLRSGYGAAFLGPDRVAGFEAFARRLVVVRFPDGKVLSKTPYPVPGAISATSAGESVLMRPGGQYPVAAINVTTGQMLAASMTPALDLFNDLLVSEAGDGQLHLRRLKEGEASVRIAVSPLLPSPLSALLVTSLSSDSKWLAMSGKFRGAVWNLETRKRVAMMRGFAGVHFDAAEAAMFADFPKFKDQPRTVGRLDLNAGRIAGAQPVEDGVASVQLGPVMLNARVDPKKKNVVTFEVSDVKTNLRLWSRTINEGAPTFIPLGDGDIVLGWPTHLKEAQAVIARNPILATRLPSLTRKEGEYVLEVIAARTGDTVGSVVFTRGNELSYVRRAHAAAGVLAVEDALDRVSIYSLADGRLRQRIFARHASLSPSGASLAAENTPGRLAIYDVATGEKRMELTFAHSLAAGRFVDDGRILAVTADQAVYLVDVAPATPPRLR